MDIRTLVDSHNHKDSFILCIHVVSHVPCNNATLLTILEPYGMHNFANKTNYTRIA
jgi:hypothetical protein